MILEHAEGLVIKCRRHKREPSDAELSAYVNRAASETVAAIHGDSEEELMVALANLIYEAMLAATVNDLPISPAFAELCSSKLNPDDTAAYDFILARYRRKKL